MPNSARMRVVSRKEWIVAELTKPISSLWLGPGGRERGKGWRERGGSRRERRGREDIRYLLDAWPCLDVGCVSQRMSCDWADRIDILPETLVDGLSWSCLQRSPHRVKCDHGPGGVHCWGGILRTHSWFSWKIQLEVKKVFDHWNVDIGPFIKVKKSFHL